MNSIGTIEWQNTIGGDDDDALVKIIPLNDGGFLAGGYSDSNISYDKSEPNFGPVNKFDYWILKLFSDGTPEWQKTFGGTESDILLSLAQTNDDGFILGGYSASGVSGLKTDPLIGLNDYWVVKLFPEICGVPTGLFTNNITATKATAHWDSNPAADSYQIWYRQTGVATWIKKTVTMNLKTLKSLSPETTYEYKVRTKCSEGEFSDFTSIQNFTTLLLKTGEIADYFKIEIYPNPARDLITIIMDSTFTTNSTSLTIVDLLGNIVLETLITSSSIELDIKHLPKGMYFVNISTAEINKSIQFIHH